MTDNELMEWCRTESKSKDFIHFPEEVFSTLDNEQASMIAENFGHNTLMRLPAREIRFFEWLRKNDSKVWDDLWGTEDELPYLVGVSFLPRLLDKTRGFPICDLLSTDNYYFSDAHIVDAESKIMLDSVKERFMANEELSVAQLLILEISIAPIDIWRFAFNHGINLDEAKNAVNELVDDKLLVHLRDAEHLAGFIDF